MFCAYSRYDLKLHLCALDLGAIGQTRAVMLCSLLDARPFHERPQPDY